MGIEKEQFGQLEDGTQIDLYTLVNNQGMTAKIINYGGIVVSLKVPDRGGHPDNVVLGYDTLEPYLKNPTYFGATIGRYANRIARGRFTIGQTAYQVTVNEGRNHLHGGRKGLDKVVWEATDATTDKTPKLKLVHTSPHGADGFPGNLDVTVYYSLTAENALGVEYKAVIDQPSPVNLTNHSYFNLAGAGSGSILDHRMQINARHFTPVGEDLIPTGEIRTVADTPMDFTESTTIGERIHTSDQQLKIAGGYDHNWILEDREGALGWAARVYEPGSGRLLDVHTTTPGIQFYSGNFMPNGLQGRNGKVYNHQGGLCLEAGHYPDSPNQAHFPSTILMPGDTYSQTTIYKFSIR